MATQQPGLRRPILQLDKAAATKAKLRLPARTSDTVSHLDTYVEIPIPESTSLSKSLYESFGSVTFASTHGSITCSYCPTKFGGIHRERDYGRHRREKHKVDMLQKLEHRSQSHVGGIKRENVSSSKFSGDLIGAAIQDNEVLSQFGNSVDNVNINEPTSSPNKLIRRPLEEGVCADDSFAQFFGGGSGGGGKGQFGDRPNRFLIKESHISIVLCTGDYSKWVGYSFSKGGSVGTDDEVNGEGDSEGCGEGDSDGPVATDGPQRNPTWKDGWKFTSAHKSCRKKLSYTISEDRTMHVLERRKARLIALVQPKSRVVKVDQLAREPGDGQQQRFRDRYPCPHLNCNKSFYRLAHLRIHINSHMRNKPYRCKVLECGQSFMHLSNLEDHERCHAAAPPLSA
ncbi:hypothetical protein IG631_19656 [Alternaria alternata]|nr:hypothetical protein IG631_19656 [Alternaria alternata]